MKSKIIVLLKQSINEFNNDHGGLLAASIAFNLFFSLFPLAFAAVYFAGFLTESQDIQEQIIRGINFLLPQSRQLIETVVSNVTTARNEMGLLSIIGVIWGGSSFFNAVRISLNAAWGISNPQPIFKGELVNLTMLMGAGILVVLSILLTTMFTVYEPGAQLKAAEFIGHSLTMRIISNVLISMLAFLVFLLLYKFIPSIRPKWKDIWLGALIAAIAFEVTKVIFIGYVRIFQPYNLVYGSIGTAIAFLMWTYLSALVFLLVAKIIHVNIKMKTISANL